MFERRTEKTENHYQNRENISSMNYVFNEECNNIIYVGNELMQEHNITNNNAKQPKVISKRFSKADTNFHHEKYKANVMHGYFTWIFENDQRIDQNSSKSWEKNKSWHHILKSIYQLSKSKKFWKRFSWIKEKKMPEKGHLVTINNVYVRETFNLKHV